MSLKCSLDIVMQISTSNNSSQYILQTRTVELISLFFMVDFSIKILNVHIRKFFFLQFTLLLNFWIHPRECYTKRNEQMQRKVNSNQTRKLFLGCSRGKQMLTHKEFSKCQKEQQKDSFQVWTPNNHLSSF